ncbi:hypothetical protein ACWGB8_29085 [Kitasatospora sp. NPDC054939]
MTTESVEPSRTDAAPPADPTTPADPPTAPATGPTATGPIAAAPAGPPADPLLPPAPAVPPTAPAEVLGSGHAEDGPGPEPRPRRPRPVLLLVSALVLGTLAGGGLGYNIQAQRPATPLPPLQVALPGYPAGAVDPAAAAEARPKPLGIDGDLRKLVMTAPTGSAPWDDHPDTPSWTSIGEFADHYGDSGRIFRSLNAEGFRRAAEVDWEKDGVKFRVMLIQYDADHPAGAKNRAKEFGLDPFAEGAPGGYRVETTPDYWAETTEPYYFGFATARRGTVVMEVSAYGDKPVDPAALKEIAKQQWERLA